MLLGKEENKVERKNNYQVNEQTICCIRTVQQFSSHRNIILSNNPCKRIFIRVKKIKYWVTEFLHSSNKMAHYWQHKGRHPIHITFPQSIITVRKVVFCLRKERKVVIRLCIINFDNIYISPGRPSGFQSSYQGLQTMLPVVFWCQIDSIGPNFNCVQYMKLLFVIITWVNSVASS